MAFTDDHPPFSSANLDDYAVGQPLKARRHRRDTATIALVMLSENLAGRLVKPGPTGEAASELGGIVAAAGHQTSEQPLLFGGA